MSSAEKRNALIGLLLIPLLIYGVWWIISSDSLQLTTLEPSGSFTLLSVEIFPKENTDKPTVYGYPILGQVELSDASLKKELVMGLQNAYEPDPKYKIACFNPRHCLRIQQKNRTFEYLICFECLQFEEYLNGRMTRHAHLRKEKSNQIQPLFDKPLLEKGIPIAK